MKVELELADDGTVTDDVLKALPDPIKKYFAEGSDRGFKEGYAKGMATKARELQPHLVDPLDREKTAQAMAELEERRIKDAERDKRYEEAMKLREDSHKRDIDARQQEIVKREQKLRKAIGSEIRAAAVQAGARDESVHELMMILGAEVDLNEDLEPYVKGTDGKPALDAKGQALTIEGRVKAYLDANRHHLKSNTGTGGGARGGASFAHLSADGQDAARAVEVAQARITGGDRSDVAVNALFEAQRKLKRAQAGA